MSESTPAPPSSEAVVQMHSAYASVTQPTLSRFEALVNELLHTQKALEAAMLREQTQVNEKLAPRITKIEATVCYNFSLPLMLRNVCENCVVVLTVFCVSQMSKLPAYVDKVARIQQHMALISRRMQTIAARKQDIIKEMSDAQRTEYKVSPFHFYYLSNK
jgi:hypothetical protein